MLGVCGTGGADSGCIRRSLTQGGWYGFVSGLGWATADALYGCKAAFGLAWLNHLLIGFQLIGGVLLAWIDWRTCSLLATEEERSCPMRECSVN